MFPALCQPFFDAVAIGDAEGVVPKIVSGLLPRRAAARLRGLGVRRSAPSRSPVSTSPPDQQGMPMSFEATRGCPFACDFCTLTGVGTRFHARPPELVVRDLKGGRRLLQGKIAAYRLPAVLFVDNNIGGNLPYLARLCEAITPLRIRFGASITFNCLLDEDIVKALARAGCRVLFTGLESFNPAAIADMRKHQNLLDSIRFALDQCRRHGILVMSGLMLSPATDDWTYVQTIPAKLQETGLHIPNYICLESPFPGTPYFQRLATDPRNVFLPNALLRDFNGYTLVVRPERESVDDFVGQYKWVLDATYTKASQGEEARRGSSPAVCVGCLGIRDGGYRPSVLRRATRSRVRAARTWQPRTCRLLSARRCRSSRTTSTRRTNTTR